MPFRRRFAALAVSLGLAFAFAGHAAAAPSAAAEAMFNAGISAYRVGDLQRAAGDWGRAAEGGHPIAAYLAGQLYEQGRGVPRSEANAFHFYSLAASAGHAEAAVKVGLVYRDGNKELGIKRSYPKAFEMFEKAALAALPEAQYYLADMYRRGLGVPMQRSESLRWLILAGAKHHVPSLLELARIHFDGDGVNQDRIVGWSFLDLASRFAEGDEAKRVNAVMDKYSRRVQASEREQAKQVADDWLAKHS